MGDRRTPRIYSTAEEMDTMFRIKELEARLKLTEAVVAAAREVIQNAQHEGVRFERFAREVMASMLPRTLAALDATEETKP